MRIIIESEIVEDNDAEVLQDFDGSSLDVFADDVSTFLITQITIFEIAATIGIGQAKSSWLYFCPLGPTSKRRQR